MNDTRQPAAIVTGGSGGIGSAIAEDLAAHGYSVTSLVRRAPTDPKPSVSYVVADVAIADAVEAATASVVAQSGSVEVLVTTAAVLRTAPIHETTEELGDELMDVNLKGVFHACRAVLPYMIAASKGSIVNLSSVHAVASIPGTGAYAATKGAIISLSKQLAMEYADHGVRVNAVVVGSVDTAMTDLHRDLIKRAGVVTKPPPGQVGRVARPEEIAAAVRFLVGNESSFITGTAITVDGGLLSRLM